MNGHDEETYERKDLPTAFISREEHERILWEYNNYKVQAYEQLIELDKLREENEKLKEDIKSLLEERQMLLKALE